MFSIDNSKLKITHLGTKECVTGSCHLIQTRPDSQDNTNILVDCGKAYGKDPELPFDRFPVKPADIDYLFLTHAHIDHIGRVPDIIDAGFKGEIICTHATKALLIPMLHDAMSFSGRTDRQTEKMESKIDDLSWGFELYETLSLKKGITFKLSNAGHILGSCFILFNFPVPDSNLDSNPDSKDFNLKVTRTVIFSGDLGCIDTPILPDPDLPDACDLLVLESTYGDRNHTNRKERAATLKNLLQKARYLLIRRSGLRLQKYIQPLKNSGIKKQKHLNQRATTQLILKISMQFKHTVIINNCLTLMALP